MQMFHQSKSPTPSLLSGCRSSNNHLLYLYAHISSHICLLRCLWGFAGSIDLSLDKISHNHVHLPYCSDKKKHNVQVWIILIYFKPHIFFYREINRLVNCWCLFDIMILWHIIALDISFNPDSFQVTSYKHTGSFVQKYCLCRILPH